MGAARAYLEVADLVLDENADVAMPGVAAGLAVLAGIAASDGISAVRLEEIHRGAEHRGAAELLRGATADGSKLKATFLKLIDLKDEAHYGLDLGPATQGQGRSALGKAARGPRSRRTPALSKNSSVGMAEARIAAMVGRSPDRAMGFGRRVMAQEGYGRRHGSAGR